MSLFENFVIPGLFNYWVAIFLMMAGFYVVISWAIWSRRSSA